MARNVVKEWLTKDKLTLLKGWARDGLTDEQIAHNIGIARQTLSKWKKQYDDIGDTIKKGKEIVDYEVENALLSKALGHKKVIKEQKIDKFGNIYEIEKEVYVPPDTIAIIFWLKNRKPNNWKDVVVQESNEDEFAKVDELLAKMKEEADK